MEHLQVASAFPHGVSGLVVHETHISWVLLTGEFAYKIRKPIKTGFLNFSTLARRREDCEAELRLNRRFAPDLYVDVLPITGTVLAPQVGGSGEPIEYAVRMRQFPQEALLSRVVEAGRLKPAHIDELAKVVSEFHQRAAVANTQTRWGAPEEVVQEAIDNFAFLSPPPEGVSTGAVSDLESWTRRNGVVLEPVFRQRQSDGFIRECHGDLHLGNVVLWNAEDPASAPPDGQITPFDGIEFNPAFRWIDVVSDIAFAIMDVEDRGRADLANRLQNAYFERTGEYAGVSVLTWYLVYRALVRAKVAMIRAAQAETQETERVRCSDQAAEYVRLAERFTRDRPIQLLLTHGVSGSGKTTGTTPLVARRGFIRIRSDVERKRLAGLQFDAATDSGVAAGLYTPRRNQETYEHLALCARDVLRSGRSVVIDAACLRSSDRDLFRKLAVRERAEFVILLFDAPRAALERRIETRRCAGRDASEATIEVLATQLASRQPLSTSELACARTVDQFLADND